jgi:hypothetical protein
MASSYPLFTQTRSSSFSALLQSRPSFSRELVRFRHGDTFELFSHILQRAVGVLCSVMPKESTDTAKTSLVVPWAVRLPRPTPTLIQYSSLCIP